MFVFLRSFSPHSSTLLQPVQLHLASFLPSASASYISSRFTFIHSYSFLHLTSESVSAFGSTLQNHYKVLSRWTVLIFLIYFVRLPLTIEAGCAVEEGKSGELVAQTGRFLASLEGEGCRVRFR